MNSLAFFYPTNDAGQRLLDDHIRPLCQRYGLHLQVLPPDSNRAVGVLVQATRTFVVWDLSVEGPENVYAALVMQAKMSRRNVLLSRTPLPRNVLGASQCAPVHGETFTNEVLGEWLDRYLFRERGLGDPDTAGPDKIAGHYWLSERPADYFLSFRGSRQTEAERWRDEYQQANGVSIRMVPPNEYSYPTEVVTRQQLWEGAARLMREIMAIKRAIVLLSPDYFDSYWTATELMLLLWLDRWRPHRKKVAVRPEARFAIGGPADGLRDLADAMNYYGIPPLDQGHADRLVHLINNADPVTSAPETQIAPRGPAKLVALALRNRQGFYRPEFQTEEFWHTVRVPCPSCKPRNRLPSDVDWSEHVRMPAESDPIDYYGYFRADAADLGNGQVTCARCRATLRVVNRRGVRTLWQPIMTTELDQDRPIIQHLKIWEVL